MLDPQELGEVLRQFKANGKKTFAIYEAEYGTNSLGTYLLASYFGKLIFKDSKKIAYHGITDQIYMAECCSLNLVGIRIDAPFVKNMLHKIGIEPELGQRREYKA